MAQSSSKSSTTVKPPVIHAYIRVSTFDQARGDKSSLGTQEKRLREWANTWEPNKEFKLWKDEGVSGSIKLRERPEGAKMLAEIAPFDTLVATRVDRLFRNATDALNVAKELKTAPTDLVLLDLGVEPVTANGAAKLFFNMMVVFAEFERERLMERIAEGRRARVAKSFFVGGDPPYGFKLVGFGRDAKLEPDQTEIETVIEARRLYAAGYTLRGVSKQLKAWGRMSRVGKLFTAQQIKRFVTKNTLPEIAPPAP